MPPIEKLDVIHLPEETSLYRIQLKKPLKTSVQVGDVLMPPTDVMSGRFDCENRFTAYFADSPLTSLYETFFRTDEDGSVDYKRLQQRCIAEFKVNAPLKLVDLRRLAGKYPVLQSQRQVETRLLSAACVEAGFDGLIYWSIRHPGHYCLCLYETGLAEVRRAKTRPLTKPGSGEVLKDVARASERSGVPITK